VQVRREAWTVESGILLAFMTDSGIRPDYKRLGIANNQRILNIHSAFSVMLPPLLQAATSLNH
jgi:hypothetical protein